MLVLLSATPDWEQTPIGHLAPLPMRNRPVTTWRNREEGLRYVADEVRHVIEQLLEQRHQIQSGSGVVHMKPPELHSTILRREALVTESYTMLLRVDTSAVCPDGTERGREINARSPDFLLCRRASSAWR